MKRESKTVVALLMVVLLFVPHLLVAQQIRPDLSDGTGIESDAPGFSKIRITPHLGSIDAISGEIPHPNGKVAVDYKVQKGMLRAEIALPEKITGNFVWKGKMHALKAGKNTLTL